MYILYDDQGNGCRKCEYHYCPLLKHITEETEFMDYNGTHIKIKGSIDCKITGTNYRIYCTKCKKNICIYILDKQKTAFTDE